jgi:hypothetical protein
MTITYQVERWDDALCRDAGDLLRQHHDEVGEHDDTLGYDPDFDTARLLDQAGALQIITARKDGRMIGYCMFDIGTSLEHRRLTCATQRMWFVHRDHRHGRVGWRLMTESIRRLSERGVRQVYPHHRVGCPTETVAAKMMRRLGATPLELSYSLWIGD